MNETKRSRPRDPSTNTGISRRDVSLVEDGPQCSVRLLDSASDRWCIRYRVEEYEIVDGPVISHAGDAHPSLRQLTAIGFPLIAEYIVLVDDNEGIGQVFELVEGSVKWSGSGLLPSLDFG